MTSAEQSPTSKEELRGELRRVLHRAYENGIDVRGGFDCRNGADHPDWDVIVTEVDRNGRPE